eukprot:1303419-Amphidinium_carterae.2
MLWNSGRFRSGRQTVMPLELMQSLPGFEHEAEGPNDRTSEQGAHVRTKGLNVRMRPDVTRFLGSLGLLNSLGVDCKWHLAEVRDIAGKALQKHADVAANIAVAEVCRP